MTGPQPPVDFLLSASSNSLMEFELAHLNLAAKLRKNAAAILDQWVDEMALAGLARLLLENERLRSIGTFQESFNFSSGNVTNGPKRGIGAKFSEDFATHSTNAA